MNQTDYYKYLQENKLIDIFSNIYQIKYSKKIEILKSLQEKYSIETINYALYLYEKDYIKLNRMEIYRIKNILKGLCKRIENDYS